MRFFFQVSTFFVKFKICLLGTLLLRKIYYFIDIPVVTGLI